MRCFRNDLSIFMRSSRSTCSITFNRHLLSFQCHRFSTAFSAAKPDTVQVSVGSSGSIALDIYHPPRPSPGHPTIIYLPRGPLGSERVQSDRPSHNVLSSLATSANATVVMLHYRISSKHRYPTPLHDALAGYDWVMRHLATSSTLNTSSSLERGQDQYDAAGSVCVCGELIGGSLAAALAATEGRSKDPGAVRAAVLGNPVTDWTAMYSIAPAGGSSNILDAMLDTPPLAIGQPPPKRKKRASTKLKASESSWEANALNPQLSVAALLKARRELFIKPADYFDPFASPLLFFRTPTSELPGGARAEEDPLEALFAEINSGKAYGLEKRRKVHKRFPPADSDLRLPRMRVWVGEDSVLRDQGIEFARLVQRSIEMYDERRDRGRVAEDGEEEVDIRVLPELGLWSDDDIMEIGRWFGHILWSPAH